MKKLALFGAGLFLLAGCSNGAASAYADSYRSVEDLRDAFIAAGGECPSWEQKNLVRAAAESGTCKPDNVLSIYASTAARDEMVETLKSISDHITLLVGENWVVNDSAVRDLDPAFGGTLVTK